MRLKKPDEKLKIVRKKARNMGLKIKADKRLAKTPYRAMNPCAAKELKQPFIKDTITYDPTRVRTKSSLVMDINHELIEEKKMRQGWKYKAAHKHANRMQRSI